MKIYVTGDTHFEHTNIAKYTNRPNNWTELIINNWNNTIANDDIVIHLGDFCLGPTGVLDHYVSLLSGIKILTVGNHDIKPIPWYMKHGFSFACRYFKWSYGTKSILFSHKPMYHKDTTESNLIPNIDINICAHVHNNPNVILPDICKLYSIENYNYKPVLLDKLLSR